MDNGARDRFAGASAVVTGAGQGIGAAIAKGLAKNGAHVVVNGRRAATLEAVCEAITKEGGSAEYCVGDITDPVHVESIMEFAAGRHKVLDILVNNASIPGPTTRLADLTLEQWNETVAVNLTGVFLACRAALPYLERSGHGKIVNIGSAAGKEPLPNRSAYAAAKIGVVGLTRTLAHEVGLAGISVNVVSPWLVENARLRGVFFSMAKERGLTADELRAEMTEETAFKRTVSETDVVEVVLFLCSRAADNITGQDINVNAGAIMH
ncbi:MAG: SDR family NAD(P)-dependent oxidoreductase [Acidimicrobiales bacterium]|jgi:NAD(P)-dependent dehydrogenase (short-subunit alcohol dehydrogenase family)